MFSHFQNIWNSISRLNNVLTVIVSDVLVNEVVVVINSTTTLEKMNKCREQLTKRKLTGTSEMVVECPNWPIPSRIDDDLPFTG
jgi:hypothetical protein